MRNRDPRLVKALREAIRLQVRKHLNEEENLFADDAEENPPVGKEAPAPQPEKTEKTAPTPEAKPEQAPLSSNGAEDEVSLNVVIEKLNTIRSGRSLKDEEVMTQMQKYYDSLDEAEKKAIQAFFTGVAQVISGGVEGDAAVDPSETPAPGVKMIDKSQEKAHEVKPNVIRKGGSGGEKKSSVPAENITPPVSVKRR